MLKITLSGLWFFSWVLLHHKLVPSTIIGSQDAVLNRVIEPLFGGYLGGFAACAALILSFYIYTIGLDADHGI